jgi:hypothetical protein
LALPNVLAQKYSQFKSAIQAVATKYKVEIVVLGLLLLFVP